MKSAKRKAKSGFNGWIYTSMPADATRLFFAGMLATLKLCAT
jgi:hypothetical protein